MRGAVVICDRPLVGNNGSLDQRVIGAWSIVIRAFGGGLTAFIGDQVLHTLMLRHLQGLCFQRGIDIVRIDGIGNRQLICQFEVKGNQAVGFDTTALDVEERQRMLMGRVTVNIDGVKLVKDILVASRRYIAANDRVIILMGKAGLIFCICDFTRRLTKVDISLHSAMRTADIQYQLVVNKDPNIVIASEIKGHVLAVRRFSVGRHGELYIKPRTESEVFLTKREECVYTIIVFISSITRFGILTDLIIVGAVVIGKSLGAAIFIRDFQTVILAVKNIIAGVILSIRSAFIRGVLTELELFAAVGRANAFAGQKAAVKIRNNLGVIALRDIIAVERIIDQPLCRSGR